MAKVEQIRVVVEQVKYPRVTDTPTEGPVWHSLDTNMGIAAGSMSWRPAEGERLILEGSWGAWRGQRQFKFSAVAVDVAETPRAKLAYVSERCHGVGSAMELLIWETWGEKWEEMYSSGQLSRFNGRIFENFSTALGAVNLEEGKGRAIAWLMSKGASINMATAAYTEWKESMVGIVERDCYRLASLSNYSFSDVDRKVRQAFGIEDADPRRITSGILYAIGQLTGHGSTLVEWPELLRQTIGLLGAPFRDLIVGQVATLFASGDLFRFGGANAVSLSRDYWAELTIWQFATERNA